MATSAKPLMMVVAQWAKGSQEALMLCISARALVSGKSAEVADRAYEHSRGRPRRKVHVEACQRQLLRRPAHDPLDRWSTLWAGVSRTLGPAG